MALFICTSVLHNVGAKNQNEGGQEDLRRKKNLKESSETVAAVIIAEVTEDRAISIEELGKNE